MKNPFKYGELTPETAFCNRQAEIKRLHQAFADAQNVILISPRRWGKTSLVDVALSRHKGKLLVAKIDSFGITSEEQFLEAYLKAVLKAGNTKLQDLTNTAKKFISSLIPYLTFSIGDFDEVKISLTTSGNPIDVDAILELPENIARERKRRMVVCVDEFQKVAEWPTGKSLLEKLRSRWQRHHEVGYYLYGSKRHLMTSIFSDSSQPFYKFGETIHLNKIAREEWVQFVVGQFKVSGKIITEDLAGLIADRTGCHSYYVQYFARLCWNEASRVLTIQQLEAAWAYLLNDHQPVFRQIADSLTAYQANYLKAFCAGEKQFTSQRVLQQYNLGSPGNIQRIEKSLEDQEIINFFPDQAEFAEPYFEPLFRKYFLN